MTRVKLLVIIAAIVCCALVLAYFQRSNSYTFNYLGIAFKYSESAQVLNVDENHLAIVRKTETDNDPVSAVIISGGNDMLEMTAEEWLLGPNSGFNPASSSYSHINIDGQSGVLADNNTWAIVKTPDGNWRISVAIFSSEGTEPMQDEFDKIIKSLTFTVPQDDWLF